MGTISNTTLLAIFSGLAITLMMNSSVVYAGVPADTTPPEVTILLTPNDLSFDTTPTFSFSVFDVSPVDIECRVDSEAFAPCTSPFTHFSPLNSGPHTFEVRATDFFGNTATSSHSWTILILTQAADDLILIIENEDLGKNIENSLIAPLKQVSKILNDGNPGNDQAACDKLTEFLDHLASKADKIDDVDLVNYLQAYGQAIKDEIGCPLV